MKKLLLTLLAVIVITACSTEKKEEIKTEAPAAVEQTSTNLEITNSWIRPSAKGTNTAFFFDAVNGTDIDDTLLSAKSDIAEVVQVHETYQADKGMMGMREVKGVPVAKNSTVNFKPRSLHVMLIKLKHDVKTGEEYKIELNFAKKGTIEITAPVKDMLMKQTMGEQKH
ncbi:MAG: copper chaperone PCu(A)C [Melioribacteraceae bacterium]|nr:copper chaperone PCu(A)C [Melioribacteraceae bacterium]